jgi:hypothetical protein
MEESMRLRDSNIQSLKAQNRALGKLLGNKSEKIKVDTPKTADTSQADEVSQAGEVSQTDEASQAGEILQAGEAVEKPKEKSPFNPKDRGNNNARRKEFFDMVIELVEILKRSLKIFIPIILHLIRKRRK